MRTFSLHVPKGVAAEPLNLPVSRLLMATSFAVALVCLVLFAILNKWWSQMLSCSASGKKTVSQE